MTALQVDGLQVWRGETKALQSVSFTANRSDVVALLGPNGAGKTTLFDVLSGVTRPVTGSVLLDGRDLLSFAPWQRSQLGVARSFQEVRLAWEMSVLDHLKLAIAAKDHGSVWSSLLRRGATRQREQELTQAARGALSGHPLESDSAAPARELSFGQQKVLALSCCCQGNPALVLLDEPLSGLAADLKDWVLARVRDLAQGGATVLIAEHDVSTVTRVAGKKLLLDGGAVREYGRIDQGHVTTTHAAAPT